MVVESRLNTRYALAAALLSVVAHLLLLAFADRVRLGGLAPPRLRMPARRMVVSLVDIRDRVFKTPPEKTTEELRQELARQAGDFADDSTPVRDLLKDQNLLPTPETQIQLKGLGRNLVLPDLDATLPPAPATAPRPQIIEIDADRLPALAATRPLVPKVPRVPYDGDRLPGFADGGELRPGSPGTLGVGLRLSMPGTTPDLGKLPPEVAPRPDSRPEPAVALPRLPGLEDDEGFSSLDDLLNVTMTVYQPANEDGYFRIDISPNERSRRLRTISKDVLFLIDCSTSIQPAKLEAFREATVRALDLLNSEDRFNVVSFRTSPDSLFEGYERVTPAAVARGREYVGKLMRGGLTDVYAGLAPYVGGRPADRSRPLLVYILTDGNSTVRNKLDNDVLLRRIAEINRSDVTVYSASTGKGINRFLLDLLAYCSRGAPLYRSDPDGFDLQLAQFVGAHRDVIVAGIDYGVSGGLASQIYPRRLPHLYRHSTLSIHGRFPRNTREIGLRLAGTSAEGENQDFVFRGDIGKAARGGDELRTDWIAQKVFHLLVQRTLHPDPAIDRELADLRDRHNLEIPYFR
ncbi:MAG: von Willebrand factor type A domain protein [Lentisphaerae bacterium ADurb.BinA184]|nr:MAG: von Willebrand factor type A domain protein [Lentisphaerae bacterium ADurb.BinA184]